ncbi:MAG: asparagine synthase [Deltaproteobacteria bacterium SG8_13]|nr:MAG: asparagine synthase [Deltaproteobacteria bacterium SG8_13]
MCGICGFIGNGDEEDLKRMTAAVAHRGPDEQGYWFDPQCAVYLGHRRLAIVDIPGGHQPMWTADGRIGVIFNGEIYNHLQLRDELIRTGSVFTSDHSDTEVLLHGYRRWGTQLPGRLNGMWAFALWDRTTKQLFISRDRFGKKPLYYTFQNHTFAFASELTSLTRHRKLAAALSKANLKKYFAYGFIPSPGCLFKGFHKLPGGCNLLFDLRNQTFKTWRYWEFTIEPFTRIPKNAEEQWGEEIRTLLRAAVKRRLMADVPLGVLLSGGLDSSSITAMAAQLVDRGKLKTFTIGFEEPSFDEARFAEDVAGRYGTDHHHQTFSVERIRKHLPDIADRLDEPFGDSSILPTYVLCRMARKQVTVALSGEGGDELFAGYDPFRALALARLYAAVTPRPLHPAVRMAAALLPTAHRYMATGFRIQRFLRGLSYPQPLWNPVWLGPLEPVELEELFREPTDIEAVYCEAIECWENATSKNTADQTLEFYTKLYLQDNIMVKADRAGMMNSLEVRSPYLDIELVNFVRRIPSEWKLRRGRTKYILKKALAPLLPAQLIHRTKQGFAAPVGKWFLESKLRWHDGGTPADLSQRFIDRMRSQHLSAKTDHRLFLWNIWLLQQHGGGVLP